MCTTECESRSTCLFKSPHAYSKPTQVGVRAGQGLWLGAGPLGPRIRRLMRMCNGPSPTYRPPEGEECETSVEHVLPLWAEPAVGYCSR